MSKSVQNIAENSPRRPRLNVGGKAHALAVEVVIVMVIVFDLFIYL
jgi:hypothetical protein